MPNNSPAFVKLPVDATATNTFILKSSNIRIYVNLTKVHILSKF